MSHFVPLIISGEVFQERCDLWCGLPEDFRFNPLIRKTPTKHFNLADLSGSWNNPRVLFCYGHRLSLFQEKMNQLENPFILVTHNSDENITDRYLPLLEHPKLLHMYSQNPCIRHPRLSMLPIGIANSMWPHGSVSALLHAREVVALPPEKRNPVYFFFSTATNRTKREECRRILEGNGFHFERCGLPYEAYLKRLRSCLFCICPDGNGADTHRLWECYYCEVVPILKRCVFTTYLEDAGLPCIFVNDWNELTPKQLTAERYLSSDIANAVNKMLTFVRDL